MSENTPSGKIAISTDLAPKAIGPYSQAVRSGDLIFVSGQIALDPGTGELAVGGIEAETRQALKNLSQVLVAAGATWKEVVRTTLYLTNLADFAAVNAVYSEFVGPTTPPARATVQVSALPRGAAIEIDAVAHILDKQ